MTDQKLSKHMVEESPFRGWMARHLAGLPLMNMISRRILGAGPLVFVFHRVLPHAEQCYEPEMTTSKQVFARFLDWLSENYRVVPLELIASRNCKTIDRRKPVCAITFDDGWIDNFIHAFPLLRERQLPATIFLPVRFVGTLRQFWQERLWVFCSQSHPNLLVTSLAECSRRFPWFPPEDRFWGSYSALKRFLMTRPSEDAEDFVQGLEEFTKVAVPITRSFLDWQQVRSMLNAGITFGSHTLHHTLLTNAAPRLSRNEIRQSRIELCERLGVEVAGFSYPWGRCNPISLHQVEESGYSFAVTATAGVVSSSDNPWLLPRISVSSSALLQDGVNFSPRNSDLRFAKQILTSKRFLGRGTNARSNLDRIRIVYIIDLIDGWKGGTESQLRALIRTLDREYFDPELICLVRFADVPLDTFPCRVHFLCPDQLSLPLPLRLVRLVRLLRTIKPHVAQTYFPEGNTLGVVAAWLANVPLIVGTTRNMRDGQTVGYRIIRRVARRLADHWQCNSKAVWNYERKETRVSPEKMEILPNTLNLTRFSGVTAEQRNRLRAQLGLSGRRPIIIAVANLRPVKDLATLVEGARHVHNQLPDAIFLILGDGPLYNELRQHIYKAGLIDVVKLVGGQADVTSYLACADIAVLTSLSEGSSNSLLEYMAMAVPPVVSGIPANRELAQGVFFTPGNARELAVQLIKLWQDAPLAKNLAERHWRSLPQFSPEAVLRHAEGFYNRLVPQSF
jgi:glycosyltransferase involved in cell wall biosynthesis/peptidoglycan/xylan/chitin deacetylase (PgdA/CDA1 family)